jgi:hypothetical protein
VHVVAELEERARHFADVIDLYGADERVPVHRDPGVDEPVLVEVRAVGAAVVDGVVQELGVDERVVVAAEAVRAYAVHDVVVDGDALHDAALERDALHLVGAGRVTADRVLDEELVLRVDLDARAGQAAVHRDPVVEVVVLDDVVVRARAGPPLRHDGGRVHAVDARELVHAVLPEDGVVHVLDDVEVLVPAADRLAADARRGRSLQADDRPGIASFLVAVIEDRRLSGYANQCWGAGASTTIRHSSPTHPPGGGTSAGPSEVGARSPMSPVLPPIKTATHVLTRSAGSCAEDEEPALGCRLRAPSVR